MIVFSSMKLIIGVEVTKSDFTNIDDPPLDLKECCKNFDAKVYINNEEVWQYCPRCGSRLKPRVPPLEHLLKKVDWEDGRFWADVIQCNLKYEYKCSFQKLSERKSPCVLGYYIGDNYIQLTSYGKSKHVNSEMGYSPIEGDKVLNAFKLFGDEIQPHLPDRQPNLYMVSIIRED